MPINGIKVEVPNQPPVNNNNPEPEIEKLKELFQNFINYSTNFITDVLQSGQVDEALFPYLVSYKENLDNLGYEIGTFSPNRNATQSSNSIGNLFENGNEQSLSKDVIK